MVNKVAGKRNAYRSLAGCTKIIAVMLAAVLFSAASSDAGRQQDRMLQRAKKAMESADPAMGDYQGEWTLDNGADYGQLVAQVIALGKGQYRANLNGEFNYDWPPIVTIDGKLEDATVQFSGRGQFEGIELDVKAVIKADKLTGKFKGRDDYGQDISGSFEMEKVIRLSPTLGAKPPAGAIVLFNGKNFDQWQHVGKKPGADSVQWRLLKGGAMELKPRTGSIITRKKFADVKLHLEFRTPFMPDARGQGRGNSGVYLQGRYEVQILDSYGLEGKDNECGGIYKVGPPMVNMCAPPTQWQTYDITFRAARFNENGEKTSEPTLTVLHNGVKIHDEVEASKPTTAAPDNTVKGPGGLYLQDHGNPVQYRNIWLVELPEANP
jgi:hypothetical protein